MNVGTVYLSHGVVTISSHCHPHELVISQHVKMNHMLIFMISMFLLFLKQEISAYVTHIYNSLLWVRLVSLVDIAAGDVINIDLIHLYGPRKTFNWHQHRDSCYVPVKTLFKKVTTPTTSTERTYKINGKGYKKLFLHLPNFGNNKLLYIVVLLLLFAKFYISVNKCFIRKAKTWQYSYF